LKKKTKEIRKELGARVRHQLRSIPELKFFIDDTLDYVLKWRSFLISNQEGGGNWCSKDEGDK
jgi:ribosome-binding factor A